MEIQKIDPEVTIIRNFLKPEIYQKIYEYCISPEAWVFDDPYHDRRCVKNSHDETISKYSSILREEINALSEENEIYIFNNYYTKYIAEKSFAFAFTPHNDSDGYSELSKHISRGALYYINDDFDGGELIYPKKNISIKPEKNMLVVHGSSGDCLHGVNRITSGNRILSIGFFYEKDYYEYFHMEN